jgi:hypothetical protein
LDQHICRACAGEAGRVVLDLGTQPACDYFPGRDDPRPDPAYPLQMWLCSLCGLAQLVADPTVPEEPRGTEPAALVKQAADAVGRVAGAGLLSPGSKVAEYGSPHGGSWLGLLSARGLTPAGSGEQADVIIDCFGLMHSAGQSGALAARAARVAPGGVLLLQYHSLDSIVRFGQWNALRHGHYAYYSTTALAGMLARCGFGLRTAWHFDLYGGTILLASARIGERPGEEDEAVRSLLERDTATGIRDPAVLAGLQARAQAHAEGLREWLVGERSAGRSVLGYGAASRAVALLCRANVDHVLLPGVVDTSPAKQGRRMPGTDIPVLSAAELARRQPDSVALFLADLRPEVRAAFPEVEAAGGRWVDVDSLSSFPDDRSGRL